MLDTIPLDKWRFRIQWEGYGMSPLVRTYESLPPPVRKYADRMLVDIMEPDQAPSYRFVEHTCAASYVGVLHAFFI
ncbi:MAG: hypothetical protein HYY37_01525 [Candidatus Aenigmarchaeota archaeon]|nr:hypothetical protein [Candidatus Aenigmarchaeota archaeon]